MNWSERLRAMWSSLVGPKEQDEYIDVRPERIEEQAAGVGEKHEGGLLSRLHHVSKRDQQIETLQAGYTELLELIRGIREHLDKQAQTQTMIVASVDRFNQTLVLMDETSKRSSQVMSELSERARESESLLRTMLERSEKRLMVLIGLLVAVTLMVLGFGVYFGFSARARDGRAQAVSVPLEEVSGPGIATLAPPEESGTKSPEPATSVEDYDFSGYREDAGVSSGDESADAEESPEPARKRRFLFFRR